ncbi:NUDIX hydrolase [bacterium]|nr:NUDIX hydrolase [bacterium]
MSANIRIRVAVIIRKDNKILLIEHHKNSQYYWLLPGGGLEYQEDIKACAERELKEETNLDIKVGDLAFISEAINPDGSRHLIQLVFFAEQTGGELKLGDEERLHSLRYIDISELESLQMYPPVAKHIIEAVKGTRPPSYLGNFWI